MSHDAAWLEEQARQLAQKRELLAALEDKLAAWQAEVSPEQIPEEKRGALAALARESISTLQSMIERVAAELPVSPQRNGSTAAAPLDRARG
jgi:hypothetical protein